MKKTELERRIEEWEQLSQKRGKTSNEAGEYYDEHILPSVKERFVEKSKLVLRQKTYDGLILTVGRSPEPQILSICAIAGKSTRVGLLYTEAANDSLNRIFKGMDWQYSDVFDRAHRIDGSDTTEIYRTIMELYREWEKYAESDEPKIAVGITGGKKVMASAAALAGATLRADIYYVDTDEKNKLNKPVPGSEYLRLLDNPYTVFGDLEVQKAKDLYERYDYAGARHIFEQLEEQVRTPDQVAGYKAYKLLCATYEKWDNLDIGEETGSSKELRELLEILGQYPSLPELVPLQNLKKKLRAQKEALEHLRGIFKKGNEQSALSSSVGFHFAFMLYHSALRREAQGKLDMACLILYRLLEWIGQYHLAKYDIDTSQPNYSKTGVDEAELLCQYKAKKKNAYKSAKKKLDSPPTALPIDKIALADGFHILDALDDEIVTQNPVLRWGRFLGRLEVRNQSIFAHGLKRINKDDFEGFKSLVEELFKKAQEIAEIDTTDADVFKKQHKFISPLP